MGEVKIGYKAMRSYGKDCYEPLTIDGYIVKTYYKLNEETKQRIGMQGSFAVFDNLPHLYEFLRDNEWLAGENEKFYDPEDYKVVIAKVEFIENNKGSLWYQYINDIFKFDQTLPPGTIFAKMVKPIEIISIVDEIGHEIGTLYSNGIILTRIRK